MWKRLAPIALIASAVADEVAVDAMGQTVAATSPSQLCEDEHDSQQCKLWASKHECTNNPSFMTRSCRASCLLCQSSGCQNLHDSCESWAAAGECNRNEGFMAEHCAFSCRSCFLVRRPECRRNSTANDHPDVVAGTVDATFERLVASERAPLVLHREPWIIQFDDFLTHAEADRLVEVGGHNFEESRFLGDDLVKRDGLVRNRTSTTSWCDVTSCLGDPTLQAIRQRIADLVGVPWTNSEHLQVLRYEVGQFYRQHHDQISPRDSAWGPRVYTFFMYLSDVEEGGETVFVHLDNVSVSPKKGRAILWPSVHSNDPFATDDRTYHEAMPVVRGLKYSANFWVHMWDFQTYHALGCGNEMYLQDGSLERARSG